jgi:hypothetical protein
MSDELEIPEAALAIMNSMLRAACPYIYPTPESITHALTEAAKLIVAAKLRQMADQVEASETDNMWDRRHLRFHADELDPQ